MNEKELQIVLPKLGESITEATIVRWLKKEGDSIDLDEPLVEVSTDKVNSEIPSPVAGVLKEILADNEEVLQVGEPLAILSIGENISKTSDPDSSDFFSPAILRMAKEANLSLEEMQKIKGSGSNGRVTKKDVQDYLDEKTTSSIPTGTCVTERIKMSSMRKAIAENMVRSFYEAPHASLVSEIDVTNLLKWIQKEKETFQKKHNVKLSITSFVAKAIAQALRSFPLINSSLENDTILMKKYVNLGIAVSVEQGVLVPVISHCQDLSISEIAIQVAKLAKKARSNTLEPEDVKNGTITLTNFGMAGIKIGIPIIRHSEVAIVGLGAIQKQLAVLEEDTVAIRSMMNVSLTFDHRVLDGMYGCGFLNELKHLLEEFEKLL